MESRMIAFLVWTMGFPILCSAEHYLQARRRAIQGKPAWTDREESATVLIELGFYIFLIVKLWPF